MIAPPATAPVAAAAPFNRVALIVLFVAGLVSAVAFAVLTAYAPALDAAHSRGGHALSRAGTGFSAIVELAAASGIPTRVSRDDRPGRAGLLVLTPEADADPAAVARLVKRRDGAPTLIVLPKWATTPVATHPAWIETRGPVGKPAGPLATIAPGVGVTTRATAGGERLTSPNIEGIDLSTPTTLQRLAASAGLDPIVTAADGSVILGWQSKHELFILADPDLLDNAAMHDLATARTGIALLRNLGAAKDGGLVFDATLNGFGGGRDLVRLMLEPPFFGLTLALVAVAGLAVWQATIRFGTPAAPGRAIGFGSAALIDNITALVATARREGAIAPRYAAVVGVTVAARCHAPPELDDHDRAVWLDRLGGNPVFSALAHDATLVGSPDAALASARALHRWQMETLHDR